MPLYKYTIFGRHLFCNKCATVETVTLLQRKDIDDRLKVRFDLDNVRL